jgi:hypothetical protein
MGGVLELHRCGKWYSWQSSCYQLENIIPPFVTLDKKDWEKLRFQLLLGFAVIAMWSMILAYQIGVAWLWLGSGKWGVMCDTNTQGKSEKAFMD